MLDQEGTQKDVKSEIPISNPMNDHDYCSPNKKYPSSSKVEDQDRSRINSTQLSDDLAFNDKQSLNQATSLDHDQSPSRICQQSAKISNSLEIRHKEKFTSDQLCRSISYEVSSESSSSISSSSDSEDDNLTISQNQPAKQLTHQATNSLQNPTKRGPGRPPKRANLEGTTPANNSEIRAKRPRHNVSVIDKSEWITGEEQIDSILSDQADEEPSKRRRVAPSRDSDHLYEDDLSSDYSESEQAGSEDDDSDNYNSEDDPDRLWCLCQKPHGGKFMICCDVCKDWFHGVCVNVTKLMGDRFEKEGKEWFCNECNEKMKSGIPRNAIPIKLVKKDKKKKKSASTSGKRGRGRPRKSESSTRDIATRSSSRNLRKSLDSKLGIDNNRLKRSINRPEARIETFDEFEDSQRLKVLIKERKKEFFYKRQLAEQQKAARRNELGLGRRTITADLSDSLDSLASSTNTPNMNNLPINIKSEHTKERLKPIVLQINTKKDSASIQSIPRIVTTFVRSPKKINTPEPINPSIDSLFTAEPIHITRKPQHNITNPLDHKSNDDKSNLSPDKRGPGLSNHSSKVDKNPTSDKSGDQASTPKKKRKDSETSINGSSPTGSKLVCQKIKETLETRCKTIKDIEVSSEKIETLAKEIEIQLDVCFKEGTQKYLNKFRSLIFNLRDLKNQCLVSNVLSGDITPSKLVRMSSDEMASNELAKWRERENKHSIELIKRDAQLAAQQVIVKKTHKGEEVISAPSITDPDDPTADVPSQEIPTTPTKATNDGFNKLTTEATTNKSTTIEVIHSNVRPDTEEQLDNKPILIDDDTNKTSDTSNLDQCEQGTSSIKLKTSTSSVANPDAPDQPKRFSVTLQTSLNPANISRLKEPLIKPSERNDNEKLYYSSMTSPLEDLPSHGGLDESMDLDSDSIPPGLEFDETPQKSKIEPTSVWKGSITMPDIAKFKASASKIEGDCEFMTNEINHELTVCGRIAPDQVSGYIKKIKSTTKSQILIVQLFPQYAEDKEAFNTFFDYLYSRNRYGVIQTNPQILKDFYVVPIHERSGMPEVFRPMKSSAVNRKDANCLLGLLVRSKRPG